MRRTAGIHAHAVASGNCETLRDALLGERLPKRSHRSGKTLQYLMLWGSNQRAGAAMTACLVLSCGAEDKRPPFADESTAEASNDTPLSRVTESSEGSPAQPLLVDPATELDSACGETTVALEVIRPNFYFVLDASASMLEPIPGVAATTRHLAARTAIADMLRSVGHRVNYGAATFPGSSSDGCSTGTQAFVTSAGDEFNPEQQEDGATLSSLLFNLRQRSPAGGTPIGATLEAVRPIVEDLVGPTTLFLLTDGAPNCDLSAQCEISACIPNIERASFRGGPSCDANFNCCTDLFPHLCLDASGPVRELEALEKRNISTFVIGIPGSETYAAVLDEMARAGGTAREDSEQLYYAVADAEELATTIAGLGEELAIDCRIELNQPSRNAAALTVRADGRLLDATRDWVFVNGSTIELVEETCDAWRAADIRKIDVLSSCPIAEVR